MLDLFAGCGGLTAGFHASRRFRSVGAVEIDFHAASTYAMNFGKHVFVGDIAEWVRGSLPRADVVVGGPPCQGFSNLGTRDSRDPRNSLWRRYVDVLETVRPAVFVLENVPQFLKSWQYQGLRREVGRSGRLSDYVLEAAVLRADMFGVPQFRRRAIVIGRRRGISALSPGEWPASPKTRTVRDALEGVSPEVDRTDLPDSVVDVLGYRVPGAFKGQDLHVTRTPTELSRERYRAIPEGGNRYDLPDELLSPCWRRHKSGSGDVMGRLWWDRPSVTIRTEFFKPEKGRYLHPTADRPLTHLEAARLQGFPDDFLWCGSKVSIARQIGNAVPVGLASTIAERVAVALN